MSCGCTLVATCIKMQISKTQCGNLRNLPPFRFYVKPNLAILENQKTCILKLQDQKLEMEFYGVEIF